MRLLQQLIPFKRFRHIKAFNRILRRLDKDLSKLGASGLQAELLKADSLEIKPKSWWRRFFSGPGFGDTEEIMIVSTLLHECPVDIYIPMGKGGIAPPYVMCVELSEPIMGKAEYRRGSFKSKWHMEPKDKKHLSDLKRCIPKPRLKHVSTSKKIPLSGAYQIKVGHSLEPAEEGGALWTITSGYEGGTFSGGYRPRVGKYLVAVPGVIEMLRKWNKRDLLV